jgi:transcriptional regulator with XRE-family HTH domain
MWKDDQEYRELVSVLGPRLRELRRRAGLTQEELAGRMGLSSPNKALMVRLERGRTGNPGLATLGRYLRACRAGFVDVLDVLDRYTRQAPVPEARAARAIADLESRLAGQVRITQTQGKMQSAKRRVQNGGQVTQTGTDRHGRTQTGHRKGAGWR